MEILRDRDEQLDGEYTANIFKNSFHMSGLNCDNNDVTVRYNSFIV